ncbi:MAG: DUF1064 domain-containing protein [Candidatus Bathyarchaeia archaeon]
MKRSKYRAIKATVDNIKFDSKKEASRYQQLRLLEKAAQIDNLELQPKYDLIVNGFKVGFYKADFRYIENGILVVEDVKGMKTPMYNFKKKLIKAIYDIDIFET